MKKLKVLLVLVAVISLFSCKKTEKSYDEEQTTSYSDNEPTDAYPDGTYCAEVSYFNSGSGRRSTYTLNVDVASHEVTVIHWPNGGWLDSSHFLPEEIDESGTCSFTSGKGYQYDIKITGSECSSTDLVNVSNDVREDKMAVTCSRCGDNKDRYAAICERCTDHTCKRCGEYDTFMWSGDELCSKCKDKEEHTCKRCGQHDTFMWKGDELCSDCKRAG
jgi:hypothetical protein